MYKSIKPLYVVCSDIILLKKPYKYEKASWHPHSDVSANLFNTYAEGMLFAYSTSGELAS